MNQEVKKHYEQKLNELKKQHEQLIQTASTIQVEKEMKEVDEMRKETFMKDAENFYALSMREKELYLQLKDKNALLRKAYELATEIVLYENTIREM